MRYRILGRTGLRVSEIGFGARAIGGDAYGPTEDRWSKVALAKSFGYGCNFVDTADVYGRGHSEELIGRITNCRQDILIATKAGQNFYQGQVHQDFSSEYLHAACLESLKRLRKSVIDLYQLQNPPLALIQDGSVFDVMDELKRQGKIRFYGVSVSDVASGVAAIESGRPDTIQIRYNMLNPDPSCERLFDLAAQHGIGVIACEPLANGLLTGKFDGGEIFAGGDVRSEWPREFFKQGVRVADALKFLVGPDRTLAQSALRFALANPAISTVVVGCKTPGHTDENFRAAVAPPLADEDIARVRQVVRGMLEK